ncbi:hypothetical protein OG735_41150 (plasmid) [Streptomyces sp. NBC_01210]|uniref:hypothetical protein n=1 Tax=Streptomyces sp. NBC_01210 TaxID=2903774 RepID=UPI002E1161D9|nr:hypothetical protein OG735_41150 [Streptomyces sp. NBC_01210]
MSDTPTPDFSRLDDGEEQQAMDIVRDVVTWYNTQLAAERRAPVPDEERIEELQAARQTALEDQQRLGTADTEETARIAALYAARLKELNES